MIPSLRQQKLMDLLQQEKKVFFLTELVEQLHISESTLRRDLKLLSAQGRIKVLRGGGVCVNQGNVELDIESKLHVALEEKRKIARFAAELVQEGDTLFLDPSSICYLMLDYLVNKRVTVVTNSCANVTRMLHLGIPCIMIGGQTKKGTFACIGSMAEEMMRRLWFNRCFLGAGGITPQYGITNHDPAECAIKHLAIEHSGETVFLINAAKAGVMTMYQVAPVDRYRVLMDQPVPELEGYDNILVVPENREDAQDPA